MSGLAVLNTLNYHLEPALIEDRRWGRASFRQRLLTRLDTFIETAETFHQLPELRGTANKVRDLLWQRWPDTPVLLAYPAFS